jgi:hypothetical protein
MKAEGKSKEESVVNKALSDLSLPYILLKKYSYYVNLIIYIVKYTSYYYILITMFFRYKQTGSVFRMNLAKKMFNEKFLYAS